jgi:hypothetical protein
MLLKVKDTVWNLNKFVCIRYTYDHHSNSYKVYGLVKSGESFTIAVFSKEEEAKKFIDKLTNVEVIMHE